MGIAILEKFFPAKTVVTSAIIRAEISEREIEIKRLQAEIGPKLAAIATMTDAEHVKAEADIAVTKRAIKRLDARIAHLNEGLPAVIAAEEASAKATADAALLARAEACRKANAKEAKALLATYAMHANAIADVIARLKEIADETNSVNQALRTNPAADSVVSYATLYRKHPDRLATERIPFRPGHYEDSLETGCVLPPAFAGEKGAWPRS